MSSGGKNYSKRIFFVIITQVFPEKLNGRYEHFTHCKDTESVQFYIRARYEQRLFGSQHDGVASTHHTIGGMYKQCTPYT